MIVVTVVSAARLRCDVTSRYSDSGVVTRKFGGRLIIAARMDAGVSPVRTSARSLGSVDAHLLADRRDLRKRRLEVLMHVDRERLQR